MGRNCNSSSSTDSSASSLSTFNTDLKLGIGISTPHHDNSPNSRRSDWLPIKPFQRTTVAESGNRRQQETFFVKVYMEGMAIGRKLDLLAHDSYESLVKTLRLMFGTDILTDMSPKSNYVLTYEDKEGDWMMVGDVPWNMFLTTVRRLKIIQVDRS